MPWTYLEKLWKRTMESNTGRTTDASSWDKEIEVLYRLGISMEDTLQFLYFEKPDFGSFKSWIKANRKDSVISVEFEEVLSKQDLEFWDKNGYVILKEVISKEECKATENAIWEFLGMNPEKKDTWYERHAEQKGLMVNFSNHQTLNRNRLSERIYKAYVQLYKTDKIYPTIDKVSFNPPETENFKFMGSPLHWDVSLKTPIPYGLQGLLYLTDCGPDDGAFHCVPGFHKEINSWLEKLQPDEHPREKAPEALTAMPVTGNAGDFIIWQNTLPHCATANRGKTPRMVQYLTYFPNDYQSALEWI
ncbi:phytanoyl-CoA dioxygenase family protein [uncultured Flavobacterium sp.]|uniref:phytanoyl-CoA dioxygenase family protein n=1 Tax=uncultured Flavobacterium sp. TaxID=165435 RepID=UPI0011F4D346|nr:phytanoyl-CoA dioxygenase family protein [uncultured Flavobacterium sp.]THD30546.1 MAG: phytanoyl-CoA dioxygenase [Flavobacterium johnsoniae]